MGTATRSGEMIRPVVDSRGVATSTSTVGRPRTASITMRTVRRLAKVRNTGGGVSTSRSRVRRCWASGWSTTVSGMTPRIVAGQQVRLAVPWRMGESTTSKRAEKQRLPCGKRDEGGGMRGYSRVFGGLAALALLVAACSSGGTTTTGGGNKKGAGKLMCFVTDTAGINDKSFNQTGYKGLTDGAKELGYQTKYLQSHTQDDYAPNIQAFIDQKCDLIVTSGFLLGPATAEAAQKNPSQKFGIIDYDYFRTAGNHITYPNVRALTFQTDQNSFLAGYLAAGLTKTGKVGTYGGLNIPTVTIFENGFAAGIRKYNQDNGTHVQLLGWNPEKKEGTFVGGANPFQDTDAGRRIGEDLI